MSQEFNIRALEASDWQAYRDIRLEALKTHEKNYGSRYVDEAAFPDQEWIDRITSDQGRIFGLFDGQHLTGINVVYTYRDDPTGGTALLAGWYMRDGYRGKGLFAHLVNASLDWAKAQPRFDRIRVHHRDGNHASEVNIRKAGFTHIGTEDWTWPDGVTADLCIYEKRIKR
jgi:RimJ/RimL family protein N-acetyltransferase